MHKNKLTHTDLKPENILLKYDALNEEYIRNQKPTRKNMDPSSTRSQSHNIYFKILVPKYDQIKIIDMGGATWDNEHHSSVINTRQYRGPEVILGCCKWDHISDVWSIGCILAEFYTGELLFPTHEEYEHIAMMEKICGRTPRWMA